MTPNEANTSAYNKGTGVREKTRKKLGWIGRAILWGPAAIFLIMWVIIFQPWIFGRGEFPDIKAGSAAVSILAILIVGLIAVAVHDFWKKRNKET